MSFASTVSSVIDVPPTHSSGVCRIWPAWTEAISSSRDSNRSAPRSRMRATFGWTTTPGMSARTTISTATMAPAPASTDAARSGPQRKADAKRRCWSTPARR